MKKELMKSLCLAIVLSSTALTATAQGIVVNKTNGTKVYYKAAEVQSVGVYGYGEGPDNDLDGHECVDLELPSGTLWATCNIGANSPEEYGDYFSWGEVLGYNNGKTTFSWSTYKYCAGSEKTLTKYCNSGWYGNRNFTDDLTELLPEDDAATANWGIGWQMPSREQCAELLNSSNTYTEWINANGVRGYKITSKSNLKSIFLPAQGLRDDNEDSSGFGYYWSRSLYSTYQAYIIFFNSGRNIETDYSSRSFGYMVRPVRVNTAEQ